jgi:radical SAM superfamily enzyme YgiQ (UPF0313 family)
VETKQRILLLFPTIGKCLYGPGWKLSETPAPPLGPLYLASPLLRAGYPVEFIDLGVDHLGREAYFSLLMKSDILMITCITVALANILQIISDFRNVNPEGKVICGGPHCNETDLHVEGADITHYGEGEQVILDCVRGVYDPSLLAGIPGLSFFRKGVLMRNPGFNLIDDLDTLDPPARNLTEGKEYHHFYGVNVGRIFPIITSRGCPHRCTFCTFHTIPYRERSVENVATELAALKNSNTRLLLINDDNFLLKRKRVEAICDKITRMELKTKIILQGRADRIDYDLLKRLRQAGTIILIFGTESANQDVLDYYNKKTRLEQIETLLKDANRLGIITFSGYMIGAPIEELRHIENNIRFLSRVPQDFISVNILRFIYPSPLWKEAFDKGLIKQNELIVSSNSTLGNFTYKELCSLQKKMLRRFYRQGSRIIRILRKVLLNFGPVITMRFVGSLFSQVMLRSPEEIHGMTIDRELITAPETALPPVASTE